MNEPSNLNPYAPSQVATDGEIAKAGWEPRRGRVGSGQVYFFTVCACVAAGAMFGLTMAIFAGAASAFSGGGLGFDGAMVSMLLMAVYGVVVGGIIALTAAIPSVGLLMFLSILITTPDERWNASRVGRFGLYSGLLSGFLPLTIGSGFDPMATLFSIVPAIFGGLAARVVIIPLARKAGRASEPLSSEPVGNYAVPS